MLLFILLSILAWLSSWYRVPRDIRSYSADFLHEQDSH